MKKKTYFNPAMETIKIASQTQMLAGSVKATVESAPQSDDDALIRNDDFEW